VKLHSYHTRTAAGLFWALIILLATPLFAAETQTQYLSGHGKDDMVQWDFFCNNGQNSNKWSTIGVPSNWELQGFGVYSYGRDIGRNPAPKVQGKYKHTFNVPAAWSDLKVDLVFEGSMTDTQAFVNGQSAGPLHQGGYYQFKYDVTKLIKFGQDNLLEVTVDDESANASVNNAERRGDYWNYAGIFRPVYLEAKPTDAIDRVAVNAKADGSFAADVYLNGPERADGRPLMWTCQAQIMTLDGAPVGAVISKQFPINDHKTQLTGKFENPRLWNAETPNLYQVEFRLIDNTGAVVHSMRKTFGFRTIEIRSGNAPGVFVNGQRIMLKGSDRHSFWPDSGRCLSDQINDDDIALMKEMNMNAVRMSHYPPDQHFLDQCDKAGVYVLDELAGWHAKYDDAIGHTLVEAMVKRDVNHPCILFWDNGNEGGWNTNLDDDFGKWDPQQRKVIHPQQTFRGTDNTHYPQYPAVVTKSAGTVPFFPTEFLHANYDGGGGAGLEDYWNVMVHGRASSGGFIWAFLDEDVKRTDKNGIIDSDGNNAPDGILGPYREKEASYYSIRQIWSPVFLPGKWNTSGDTISVENRYAFTDLQGCSFSGEYRTYAMPSDPQSKPAVIPFDVKPDGSIPAGATGNLKLTLPTNTRGGPADTIAITAKDPNGKELWTWVYPTDNINRYRKLPQQTSDQKVAAAENTDAITVTVADLSLQFSKTSGQLTAVTRGGKPFSLVNGPRLVTGNATLASLTQKTDGADVVLTAAFTGSMQSVIYRIHPSGWLSIDYAYNLTGTQNFFGVGFDYPEANVKSMRFLGDGPAPVYKNRLTGGQLDVWDRTYNSTLSGYPTADQTGKFDYPEFKGYYAGIRWIQLRTTEGLITALVNQDDLFVQVLKPKYLGGNTIPAVLQVPFPATNFSFLHAIPAIGTKANPARTTGPQGVTPIANGDYKGSISLYFGDLHPE
jgi:hypothetical protein